jgi:hypothetical protein
MKITRNYHRRATECLAFAKIARDEEERRQLLTMAKILESLAHEHEQKDENARKSAAQLDRDRPRIE